MSKCEICMGGGTVRLPIHKEPCLIQNDQDFLAVSESCKEYACPECSTGGPVSHLYVQHMETELPLRYVEKEGEQKARLARESVMKMAEHIVKEGFVAIRARQESDFSGDVMKYQFSLGLVSPAHVASLEERVAQNNQQIAESLAGIIKDEISVWGRDYSGNEGNISKGQACDSVTSAVRKFLDR